MCVGVIKVWVECRWRASGVWVDLFGFSWCIRYDILSSLCIFSIACIGYFGVLSTWYVSGFKCLKVFQTENIYFEPFLNLINLILINYFI